MALQTKFCNKATVIGFGAWGSALAHLLSYNYNHVLIYSNNQARVDEFNNTSINADYFPDIKMPNNISATTSREDLHKSNIVICAVPTQATRSAISDFHDILSNNTTAPIVVCSKGIEITSAKVLTEVIKETGITNKLVVLAGPNFAKDILQNKNAATTIASHHDDALDIVESAFVGKQFSIEKIKDVTGLQLCGAIKNVYAIGAGIVSGMSNGESFFAAYFKKALEEVQIIIKHLGGQSNTIFSYGGIGDLLLTCSSKTSRNFSFGYALHKNHDIQPLLQGKTIEGYYTTQSIYTLLTDAVIDQLPILDLIYDVIINNKTQSIENIYKII